MSYLADLFLRTFGYGDEVEDTSLEAACARSMQAALDQDFPEPSIIEKALLSIAFQRQQYLFDIENYEAGAHFNMARAAEHAEKADEFRGKIADVKTILSGLDKHEAEITPKQLAAAE